MIEQEEKNELSRKIQELEKECECVIAFILYVQIVSPARLSCINVGSYIGSIGGIPLLHRL